VVLTYLYRYANFTDRDISSHGVEFPYGGNNHHWAQNFGAGRILHADHMEHKTSQFSLFKLLYERALRDKRRVLHPSLAQSYFIPYDIGMDATFLEANGRMRKSYCPLSREVFKRLNQSEAFHRNHGHDHTLVVSVNQNMNYFFGAPGCRDLFNLCWNCTKVSIDEYMFIAADRNYELKGRGINWHAIPFPSDYHYSTENVSVVAPWKRQDKRPLLISFTGNRRRYNAVSTLIRENLMDQCDRHPDICFNSTYRHKADLSPNDMSRSSVFCLQPPGDMPTRKSLFDAVLSGCIPVLFHPLTARFMYEWHLGQRVWDEIGIHYDSVEENHALISQSVDFIDKLHKLARDQPELVRSKQKKISQVAHQLQYSLIWIDPATKMEYVSSLQGELDAYEITMNKLLVIHSGKDKHDRVSDYLLCHYKLGPHKVKIQTAEWCNQTNSNIDPFHPPSTDSPLYKG
jgi:hypothetical protein